MKIVIPLAGFGTRFPKSDWPMPKPLIEVGGKSLLEYSVRSIPIQEEASFLFIIRDSEDSEALQREIHKICSGKEFSIHVLPMSTRGQAETVYKGTLNLNPSEDLLIHNGDSAMNTYALVFKPKSDGIFLVFNSNESRWSYASCDDSGKVKRVEEKVVISANASTGTYYFSSIGLFQESYLNSTREYDGHSEIYVAPLYNYLIEKNHTVVLHKVEDFFCLGSPLDLRINSSRLLNMWKPQW